MNVGQMFVRLGLQLDDWSRGLELAQKDIAQYEQAFTGLGTRLSAAITLPLVGIAAASTKAFAEFESSMNRVSALGDIFGKDLKALEQQAKELGATTIYSSKQAADAMGELAAAGFKANEIMSAMPGVLALAATEQMEIAEAASISAAVIKGFGLQARDMQQVADLLAKTSSASASSVKDLGYAFQYVGPVAKAAGQNMQDIAAALGVLANAGIKGETAGTGLRNMFNDLLNASKKGQDAMDALGIKAFDSTGKLKPLGDLIKELAPLVDNVGAGFAIFGQRFSDVLPLLAAGGTEFQKMREEIKTFEGSAQKMADTMRKGLKGSWEEFMSTLETAAINLGEALAPIAEKLIKFATVVVNDLAKAAEVFKMLPEPMQTFVIALLGFAAAAGPALFIMGQLAGSWKDLAIFSPILKDVGESMFFFGLKLEGTKKLLADFGSQLKSLDLQKMGEGIISAFKGVGTALLNSLKDIPNMVKTIPTMFTSAKSAVVEFGATLGTALAANASKAGAALKNFQLTMVLLYESFSGGGGAMAAIKAFAAMVGTSMVTSFAAAKTAIIGFLAAAAPVTVSIGAIVAAGVALAAIGYTIYKNWNEIKAVLIAVWKDVSTAVSGFAQYIMAWIEKAFGKQVAGYITSVWNGVKSFFVGVWDAIVGIFQNGLKWIVELALKAAQTFGMKETTIALQAWLDKLNGIPNAASKAAAGLQGVSAAAQGLVDRIKGTADKLGAEIGDITSKALIGSLDKADVQKYAQRVAQIIKEAIAEQSKISDALKKGTISQEAASKAQLELNSVIERGRDALRAMGASLDTTAPKLENLGKASKKVSEEQKELKRDMTDVARITDQVSDKLRDVPKSYNEFVSAMQNGLFNAKSALKGMLEAVSDLEARIAGETNPVIRKALQGILDQIRVAIIQTREWRAQFVFDEALESINQLADEIQRASVDFKDIELPEWLASSTIAKQAEENEKALESLGKAASLLGIELDKTNVASKGIFKDAAKDVAAIDAAWKQVVDSGRLNTEQMAEAYQKYLTTRLAAEKENLKQITIENSGFFTWMSSNIKAKATELQLATIQAIKEFKENIAAGFKSTFENLFKGDFGGALDALKKLGQDFGSGLLKIFQPLQDQLGKFVESLSEQVSTFVTKTVLEKLFPAFDGIISKMPIIGKAFQSTFGAASLDKVPQVVDAVAKSAENAANVAIKTTETAQKAVEAANTASKAAEQAANTAAKSADKVASASAQAASSFASMLSMVGAISAAISAVMSIIQFFQLRRIEQDVGRIEVTTRGQLNQLISIQETMNKYYPALLRLDYLTMLDLSLTQVTDVITDNTTRIVDALKSLTIAPAPATTDTGEKSGDSSGAAADDFATVTRPVIDGLNDNSVQMRRMTSSLETTAVEVEDLGEKMGRVGDQVEPIKWPSPSDYNQNTSAMEQNADATYANTQAINQSTPAYFAFTRTMEDASKQIASAMTGAVAGFKQTSAVFPETQVKVPTFPQVTGSAGFSMTPVSTTPVTGFQNVYTNPWPQYVSGKPPDDTLYSGYKTPLTMNFYGVTNERQIANKIVSNLRVQGVDL